MLPYRNDHLCVAMSPRDALARHASLTYAETIDQATVGVAPGGLMDQLLRRQAALLGRSLPMRSALADSKWTPADRMRETASSKVQAKS